MHHMATFGKHIRKLRKAKGLSVRKLAGSVKKDHGYLSRIEAGKVPPPSAELIKALAVELEEDPDVLMAMAGRVSERFRKALMEHPRIFGEILAHLEQAPKDALLRVVREVRDGDW